MNEDAKWRWSVMFAGAQEQKLKGSITRLSIKAFVSDTTSCLQTKRQIPEHIATRQTDEGDTEFLLGHFIRSPNTVVQQRYTLVAWKSIAKKGIFKKILATYSASSQQVYRNRLVTTWWSDKTQVEVFTKTDFSPGRLGILFCWRQELMPSGTQAHPLMQLNKTWDMAQIP